MPSHYKPDSIYSPKNWNRMYLGLLRLAFRECAKCKKTGNLEFAHLSPTGLNGRGRGQKARVANVLGHLSDYTILCDGCHLLFDRGAWDVRPPSLAEIALGFGQSLRVAA